MNQNIINLKQIQINKTKSKKQKMENLTVANQSIVNIAKPNNSNLRFKRRNGLNQFQFQQQLKNANMTSLECTMTDLSLAENDSMTDQQSLTIDYKESSE